MKQITKRTLIKRTADLLEKLSAGGLLVAFLHKEGALYGAILGFIGTFLTCALSYALSEYLEEDK